MSGVRMRSLWLIACGAGIGVSLSAAGQLDPQRASHQLLLLIGTASTLYAVAWFLLRRDEHPRWVYVVGLTLALLWRLPFLATAPLLSDDVYRYLWDGRVQRFGVSPYQAPPGDPALAHIHTDETRRANHPELPTIYPPVAQWYFRGVGAVTGDALVGFKWSLLGCEAMIVGLLWSRGRSRRGRPLALVYAWHPLTTLEVAANAHVDAVGVLLLVAAVTSLERAHRSRAATLGALAVGVKFLPGVLLPLLWRRIGPRHVLIGASALGAAAMPFVWSDGGLPLGSLGTYLEQWRFNAPVYALLERAVDSRWLAGLPVALGVLAAGLLRTRYADLPDHAWAWPMAIALLTGPASYPWYLLWLVPFLSGPAAVPLLAWTLTVPLTYEVWHVVATDGVWRLPGWVQPLEYGTVALSAILAVVLGWRTRRLSGGRALRVAPPAGTSPDGGSEEPRIAVIVPALNEEDAIVRVLEAVPCPPAWVTVVDNGSTDDTRGRAERAGARVVSEPRRGYGRACLAGLRATQDADIVVFLDADFSDSPERMMDLVRPIAEGRADLVLSRREGHGRPTHASAGTALCVGLINGLWGAHFRDLGPFRAVRRSALDRLGMRDPTWGWTIEMQVKAVEAGLRWIEVPVPYRERIGQSKISGTLAGTVRAGSRMLAIIARLWWTAPRRRLDAPATVPPATVPPAG